MTPVPPVLCEKQKESNNSVVDKSVFLFVVMAAPSRHSCPFSVIPAPFPSFLPLFRHSCPFSVIPAKAGIQKTTDPNIQPHVSKAKKRFLPLDTRLRGYDGEMALFICFVF
jgi:hypothetical protein